MAWRQGRTGSVRLYGRGLRRQPTPPTKLPKQCCLTQQIAASFVPSLCNSALIPHPARLNRYCSDSALPKLRCGQSNRPLVNHAAFLRLNRRWADKVQVYLLLPKVGISNCFYPKRLFVPMPLSGGRSIRKRRTQSGKSGFADLADTFMGNGKLFA